MSSIAKLATLATLLLVLAAASAIRTPTEISEQIVDRNWVKPCDCQEESRKVRLDACHEFTRKGCATYCRPPPQCCQKLRQVRHECRCKVIKDMTVEVLKGGCEANKEKELRERAESLTEVCGCTPQRCPFA